MRKRNDEYSSKIRNDSIIKNDQFYSWKKKQQKKKEDRQKTVNLLSMATNSIILSKRLRNDAIIIYSSEIFFHSSSKEVLSETIFGWEIAFLLFYKMPYIS